MRTRFYFLIYFSVYLVMQLWADSSLFAMTNPVMTQDEAVVGYIRTIPVYKHHHSDFIFYLNNHQNVNLRWYGLTPALHVGDAWRLCITLKSDQRAYVNQSCWPETVAAARLPVLVTMDMTINRWRQIKANHIYQAVSRADKGLAGILVALTTGSRHLLPADLNQIFQRTGTSHLMAISGLHVGLVYGMIFFVIWRVSRWVNGWGDGLWRVSLSITLSLLGAFLYGVASGLGPSTWRALIMLFLFAWSRWRSYHLNLWGILLLSFILESLCFPADWHSISFWLSYSAVMVLAYLTQYRLAFPRGVGATIKLQSLMALGLLPTSVLFFGQYPWVSLFANLIAIPWVSFLIVPLCMVSLVFCLLTGAFCDPLWRITAYLLKPLMAYLSFLSQLPCNPWLLVLKPIEIMALMIAVAAVLAPRAWPGRRLLFCGFLVLVPMIRVFDSLGWIDYHSPG